MIDRVRRLFRRRPAHAPNGGGRSDAAIALMEDLAARITSPVDAPLIIGRVSAYKKASREDRGRMLCSLYLLLEQYLSEVDRGDYARAGLRNYVKSTYPELLVEGRFRIVFQPATRQELLLCKEFLEIVLGRAVNVLGAAGGNVLIRAQQWVRESPLESAGLPPFPKNAIMPSTDPAWTELMLGVSKALYAHVAGLMGDESAARIYEDAYRLLADDLVGLETFPIIVGAMPGGLMSEDKVQLLSKSQIQRVLLEKIQSLELVNDLLSSMNEELVETQKELISARRQAELANDAKSDFLSRMSHELRTPLNSVIGFTKQLMLNKKGNLGERDLLFLERVHANGLHLLDLINDILDLAKIESGTVEVDYAPVELGELVRETVESLEGKVAGSAVRLVADLPDALAVIETDRVKLKRVLINLVGNAIKFTERGTVTVSVTTADPEGQQARIAVADTGIGIAPEHLDLIFDAFHQVEDGQSRRYHGTGLGLAISRHLCELMGYDLRVQSALGQGTRFTIDLQPAGRVADNSWV